MERRHSTKRPTTVHALGAYLDSAFRIRLEFKAVQHIVGSESGRRGSWPGSCWRRSRVADEVENRVRLHERVSCLSISQRPSPLPRPCISLGACVSADRELLQYPLSSTSSHLTQLPIDIHDSSPVNRLLLYLTCKLTTPQSQAHNTTP